MSYSRDGAASVRCDNAPCTNSIHVEDWEHLRHWVTFATIAPARLWHFCPDCVGVMTGSQGFMPASQVADKVKQKADTAIDHKPHFVKAEHDEWKAKAEYLFALVHKRGEQIVELVTERNRAILERDKWKVRAEALERAMRVNDLLECYSCVNSHVGTEKEPCAPCLENDGYIHWEFNEEEYAEDMGEL